MQCSCCREEREHLREYSFSALDANQRKTIQTLHLCPVCRIVHLVKPQFVRARAAPPCPRPRPRLVRRVA